MAHVLLVDDDADINTANRIGLEALGYRVTTASSGQEAWDQLQVAVPDVVVLDCMMEEFTSGFDLAHDIAVVHPRLPMIMLTAVGEQMSSDWKFSPDQDGDWLPVARFLSKPVTGQDLDREIRAVLAQAAPGGSA